MYNTDNLNVEINQNYIIEHGIDGNCEMKKHLKIVNTKHPRTIFYLIAISCISNIESKPMTMQRLGKTNNENCQQ